MPRTLALCVRRPYAKLGIESLILYYLEPLLVTTCPPFLDALRLRKFDLGQPVLQTGNAQKAVAWDILSISSAHLRTRAVAVGPAWVCDASYVQRSRRNRTDRRPFMVS